MNSTVEAPAKANANANANVNANVKANPISIKQNQLKS